jgi:C-terminal processing protease CtpA/Prc
LKLTVARYLTPGGADLSRGGIRPDLWAPDNPSTTRDEGLAVALLGFVIRS